MTPKLVLAPLAGFTDAPFRRLCFEGGADRAYTEMVSAAGLAHGSSPTHHLMETMEGEGPVVLQLFGAKATDLAAATAEVERFRQSGRAPAVVELNLNAGCPMTKVTREGAGAKLVENPARIGELLRAMVENTALPVTLKTRLGPHPGRTTVFEIVDAAERAGVRGIALHARYTSQMHGGDVRLDLLSEVVRQAHVPIAGNGSVTDARTLAEVSATGVAAVMIGRAALSDPAIFARLKGDGSPAFGGEAPIERHLRYLLEFRRSLAERYPNDHIPGEDAFASVKMHVHLFRYFNGRPGAAALRARLNAVRTLGEIREIIRSV